MTVYPALKPADALHSGGLVSYRPCSVTGTGVIVNRRVTIDSE